MSGTAEDPARIHTLVVSADDVVAALEARRQRGRPVVLRATPPFSGRMRARLHVDAESYDDDADRPAPLHVAPESVLESGAPEHPQPGDTEDELRADPGVEYTVERHRDRHRDAVASWRERVRDHIAETATIETPLGTQEVSIAVLG